MIKNTFYAFLVLVVFSCSKPSQEVTNNQFDEYVPLQYDTTAIDSFSAGAMSVDVAERIRRSSLAYQDSLMKAKIAEEKARKEMELQELEKQAKAEEEAKKNAKKKDSAR